MTEQEAHRNPDNELRLLRAFAAQMLAMGAAYKYDTRLESWYCVLCDCLVDMYMQGDHKSGCLVPLAEELPITADGTSLAS